MNKNYNDILREALDTQNKEMQARMSKWIPTKEHYPFAEYGEGQNVLTVDSIGEMRVLYFDGGNWCWPTGEPLLTAMKFPITHWMPLPEEPKED